MTLEVGDFVRVIATPEGFDAETASVFEACIGRSYRIAGFERGLVELEVGEVFGEPAYMRSIWIEPQFVSKGSNQD